MGRESLRAFQGSRQEQAAGAGSGNQSYKEKASRKGRKKADRMGKGYMGHCKKRGLAVVMFFNVLVWGCVSGMGCGDSGGGLESGGQGSGGWNHGSVQTAALQETEAELETKVKGENREESGARTWMETNWRNAVETGTGHSMEALEKVETVILDEEVCAYPLTEGKAPDITDKQTQKAESGKVPDFTGKQAQKAESGNAPDFTGKQTQKAESGNVLYIAAEQIQTQGSIDKQTQEPGGLEEQKRQAEWEALKAAFTDMETVEVYATTNVKVRMAPSTEAEVYTVVKRGAVLRKNGESGGWSRVLLEDGTYYIKSDYIKEKKKPTEGSHKIAIDAGHQSKANTGKEAIGPGASETKMKVTGGTRGTTTGLYEYELTLMVSQKLRTELENRGYEVYMVREGHEVDISNSERAQMAYDSGAEIFVRIHANGSENSSANGAMTICQTPQNPYVADLYADSQRLSTLVLDSLAASTGCKRERVWETDTMSGINWSQLPVTIVEMGYMTNPEEDRKMAQDDYQQLIAIGIADGIDAYFTQ